MSTEQLTEAAREYYRLQAKDYHKKYYGDSALIDEAINPLVELLQETFRRRDVLEIACGSGFWTELVGKTARSILATDVNSSMTNSAGKRLHYLRNVTWQVADAYELPDFPRKLSGAFAVLFWCHIPREKLSSFLSNLSNQLEPDSPVVFIDQLHDSDADTHVTDHNCNKICKRSVEGNVFTIPRISSMA